MEGHLGGTGIDGRQLTSGKGVEKNLYLTVALHLHQKVPGSMHWRVGGAGEPTLPLRTASGPQSHALRGKDAHFPEQSHPPHNPTPLTRYHNCAKHRSAKLCQNQFQLFF